MRLRWMSLVLALCVACPGPKEKPTAPVKPPESQASTASAKEPTKPGKEAVAPPSFRLPGGAAPLRYDATLSLTPGEEVFRGSIAITLAMPELQSVLWLNASRLTVERASLVRKGNAYDEREPIQAKIIDGGEDFVGFDFGRPLSTAEATLTVEYTGTVSKQDMGGVFQQEEGGAWYIYTQFEAADARRAFPCFDEPGFKVPWRVTLDIPAEQQGFSNGRQLEERVENGRKRLTFAETPAIPSYLVAFAAGPFEVVEAKSAPGVKAPVRIITPRGKSSWAGYAAKYSAPVLRELELYFGSEYPFEKLDQIAIPNFFGAMEHPGLVTYSSRILLAEPGQESIQFERAFLYTCAHELAHQWFGNLVTMAWWDDTWLNESFAEWAMGRAVETLRPDWAEAVRQTSDRNNVMGLDSLTSARAVRQPVTDKDGIANAFDGITYSKGEAVLVMLERHLGEAAFQRGVRRYMTAHARRNATAADFFAALSAEAGGDVAPIFQDFVDHPGVPLVTGTLSCPAGEAPALSLRQTRYLPLGASAPAQTWRLPVCVRFGDKKSSGRACTLLTGETGTLALSEAKGCPTWVLLNEDSAGYYYASYTPEALRALFTDGKKALRPAERLGLVNDLQAATASAVLPLGDALALLPSLLADKSPQTTRGAVSLVSGVSGLVPDELLPVYEAWIRTLFGGEAKRLGLLPKAKEDDEAKLTRQAVLRLVGDKGNDAALGKEARRLAEKWQKDRRAVPAESVDLVLSLAARHGDRALYDAFLADAKTTKERRDREQLLSALGNFRDPALVQESFGLVLGGEFLPVDAMSVLWGAQSTPALARLAYDYVTQNFDALVAKLPQDSLFQYGAILVYFGGGLCEEGSRREVESFFGSRVPSYVGGAQNLAQVLEGIDLCLAFRGAQRASVEGFLRGLK